MAYDYDVLRRIMTLPSSDGVALLVSSEKYFVRLIILYNGNTTAETVKLYTVPNNGGAVGTASATNQWREVSLAANETLYIEFPSPGLILESENDALRWETTTASKVTGQIFGAKE